MMNAHSAMRSAIRSYIQKDKDITSLFSQAGDVLDFQDTKITPWRRASFDGFRHKFSLYGRFPKGAEDKADAVCAAVISKLHHADIELDGHALIDLSFALSETMTRADHISCKVEFDALTISD